MALQELLDSLAHLARGFVSERDSKDVVRRNVFFRNKIRYAHGDDTRLARAGTGKDQERAIGSLNGFGLLRIK